MLANENHILKELIGAYESDIPSTFEGVTRILPAMMAWSAHHNNPHIISLTEEISELFAELGTRNKIQGADQVKGVFVIQLIVKINTLKQFINRNNIDTDPWYDNDQPTKSQPSLTDVDSPAPIESHPSSPFQEIIRIKTLQIQSESEINLQALEFENSLQAYIATKLNLEKPIEVHKFLSALLAWGRHHNNNPLVNFAENIIELLAQAANEVPIEFNDKLITKLNLLMALVDHNKNKIDIEIWHNKYLQKFTQHKAATYKLIEDINIIGKTYNKYQATTNDLTTRLRNEAQTYFATSKNNNRLSLQQLIHIETKRKVFEKHCQNHVDSASTAVKTATPDSAIDNHAKNTLLQYLSKAKTFFTHYISVRTKSALVCFAEMQTAAVFVTRGYLTETYLTPVPAQ